MSKDLQASSKQPIPSNQSAKNKASTDSLESTDLGESVLPSDIHVTRTTTPPSGGEQGSALAAGDCRAEGGNDGRADHGAQWDWKSLAEISWSDSKRDWHICRSVGVVETGSMYKKFE